VGTGSTAGIGVNLPVRARKCSLLAVPRPAVLNPGPYPMCAGIISSEVRRLLSKSDHSALSSVEVNNARIYISTPPIHLHGVVFNLLNP
jgi:hypothetical protein